MFRNSSNPWDMLSPNEIPYMAFQRSKDGQGYYAIDSPFAYLRGQAGPQQLGSFSSTESAGSEVTLTLPLLANNQIPVESELIGISHAGSAVGFNFYQTVNDFVANTGTLLVPFLVPVAAQPLATPTAAPTLTAVTPTTATSLAAGTYTVTTTFTNELGIETAQGPSASVTLVAGQEISVAAITLPSGASAVNYYAALSPNTMQYEFNSTTGATATITALPSATASNAPTTNLTSNTYDLIVANGAANSLIAKYPYTTDGPLAVHATLLNGNANPSNFGVQVRWES